ncbi:ribonuclease HII [Brevundimonas sp. LM2]|uniref:ribonuclease HII n=1 Tax=Brevundimonas sp. LM2 TaxID=1938605 RepID=UPI000986C650
MVGKTTAQAKSARPFPTMTLETLLAARVGGPVCGVDEAGRGPWAGPVAAGAVILSADNLPPGIDDSKALTAARREELAVEIKRRAVAWGVGFASVEEIETLNILQATGLAMCRAIEALMVTPKAALVDGNYRFKLPCDVETAVGGDGLSLSIAAASILAKTARDQVMIEMDAVYPGYGFAGHKGYNAPVHSAALKAMGPCAIHRRGWSPIRALLEA